MGVKGLTNVIANKAPLGIKEEKITYLKGKRVAIDMSLIVYQFLITNKFMKNEKGEATGHVYGTFFRLAGYVDNGMIPICVFDGKPPDAKKGTIQTRNKGVKESLDKIEELKKLPQTLEIKKKIYDLEKKSTRMTWQHGEDLKKLLTLMGIQWYQADGEAEAGCVWLVKNNFADTVMTEDMDTLPLGTPTLIRRRVRKGQKPDDITVFHLDKILEGLELTMEQFVDMCLLCGTDYTPSIPRVGSRTAHTYIKNNGNIIDTLEALRAKSFTMGDFVLPSNELYLEAKNIFMCSNDTIINAEDIIKKLEPLNATGLKEFLKDYIKDPKRIDNAINKLL